MDNAGTIIVSLLLIGLVAGIIDVIFTITRVT